MMTNLPTASQRDSVTTSFPYCFAAFASSGQIDREKRMVRIVQKKTKRLVEVALNSIALEIVERRWKGGTQLLFASPKSGTENE
jgi:hypothetical protein